LLTPTVRLQTRDVSEFDPAHSLINDLLLIEDPQERLGAVLDRARRRPALGNTDRNERNRVQGCQSQVWIKGTSTTKSIQFAGDSDSPLVRGLVVLLCDYFSGEIADSRARLESGIDPLESLGLSQNLSSTRRLGLQAVRIRLKQLASATPN